MRVPVDLPHACRIDKIPENYHLAFNRDLMAAKFQRLFEIKWALQERPDEKTAARLEREYEYMTDRMLPPEV